MQDEMFIECTFDTHYGRQTLNGVTTKLVTSWELTSDYTALIKTKNLINQKLYEEMLPQLGYPDEGYSCRVELPTKVLYEVIDAMKKESKYYEDCEDVQKMLHSIVQFIDMDFYPTFGFEVIIVNN